MKRQRLVVIVLLVFLLLAVAAVLAFHTATRMLRDQVEAALGPQSHVGAIDVGLSAIEVRDLRIDAPPGWPAAETLRAARIVLRPDLAALMSKQISVSSIVIEQGYVSALREANGRLRVVPSLLETPSAAKGEGGVPPVSIGRIELRDAAVEFFDASVQRPPLKIRLEQMQASVGDLRLPALDARSPLHLQGVVKGRRGDGKMSIDGEMVFSSRESHLITHLHDVDLVGLQPYLIRAGEGGVAKGRLDLDIDSTIRQGHMNAPGNLTLRGLELDPQGSTFMGLPRKAVVGLMKDRRDEIAVKFVLDGNLDDPHFRLNESFATRVASSIGETLGISLESIVRGAGSVGQKGLEAVGGAAEGVGRAIKGLLSK